MSRIKILIRNICNLAKHIIRYINMENNNNNGKIRMQVSEIIAKCKRKEDWINFARELGKDIINYCRLIFPQPTGV